MNSAELEKKVAQFMAGDRRAFDYIYEYTNRSVYFAALYILKCKTEAEDVMQETYMRALGAIDSYKTGTNFTAWLARIAKNLALNKVKRRSRETLSDFTSEAEVRRYGTKETELPFIFDVAAEILTEEQYQIIMLCHVAGYKRREVAKIMDMPIGTVTWKNNEALKKLKIFLKKEGRK